MCLAAVSSNEQLKEESDLENESSPSRVGGIGSKLKSRISFRRGQNNFKPGSGGGGEVSKEDEKSMPLLSKKGSRLAAAKMVKGMILLIL